MEGIECVGLLADAEKFDGAFGNGSHRQRRTTPRVGIYFRQNNPGQRQGLAEGLRSIGGVLPRHGIHHEQGFNRINRLVQCFDLRHHLVINRESAGRVN